MFQKAALIALLLVIFPAGTGAQTGNSKYIAKSMLIFPEQPEHVHGSSLALLPNGDVLAAWFQGSGERNADDVRIMGARLKKNARQWSAPFLMADTYNLPDCNPVLFLNRRNKLFLVWIAVNANRWENAILRYRTSENYNTDGPPVWNWQDNILLKPGDAFANEVETKLKQLPPTHHGWAAYAPQYDAMILQASKDPGKRSMGWMTRIAPLILEDGTLLLPLYSDGFNFSLTAISKDDGSSWTPGLPIVGRGNIQPAFIQKKDGTLVAFMRDNGDAPARVKISESADRGISWSPAMPTSIPNTASVAVSKLKDGKWAFVGNDIDDGRYRIRLYISADEGRSWKWSEPLEEVPKDQGSFSYPAVLTAPDGLLHISYSYKLSAGKGAAIKYVVVDPQKIIAP